MSEVRAWEAVEAVSAAVDRLLAADWSGVDDVLPMLEVIEEVARKVTVIQQLGVAELVDRDVAGSFGVRPAQLLRSLLRLSTREAKHRVERAADLAPRRALSGEPLPPRLPATAAAQAEGVLSVEHVRVIQDTMKALPAAVDPGTWAKAEQDLADRARHFDPQHLGILATRLRACVDPDGTLVTEEELVQRRELSFARDIDGSFRLRGRLDPEGAETVKVALDALAAPAPAEDGTPDPRTPARRQADALVELARRAISGGGLPDTGGRPTQLVLLANLADIQAKTGLADLGHTGAPVSVETALRMACEAEIIPTVFGEGSQVLAAGRTRRLATRHQRDVLRARDRGCAVPHCDAPPAWTQAHHIIHWINGGKTNLDNLILLCSQHHRAIHTGHWTIETIDGIPHVRPPPWARAA